MRDSEKSDQESSSAPTAKAFMDASQKPSGNSNNPAFKRARGCTFLSHYSLVS